MAESDSELERVAMIQRLDPDGVDGDVSAGYIGVKDVERYVEEYSENSDCEEWEE